MISISEKKETGKPYRLIIEDSGIGISEKDLPAIFNRFRKATLNADAGYGLGLSIVKSIGDYHQISISVNSVIDEGTRFELSFPDQIVKLKDKIRRKKNPQL